MKNPILEPQLKNYIKEGNLEGIRLLNETAPPPVIADFISTLSPREVKIVLDQADPFTRAEIFSYFDIDLQLELAAAIKRNELAQLITYMAHDDRVDLLKKIPEEKRELLLPALAQAEREDIRKLSAYPEGTVGAVMTSDYATLTINLTAREAIDKLRLEAPNKETIYYAYIIDKERKLIGFVSLKDLILARSDEAIESIMHTEVIYAKAYDDQEKAARTIQKYDLISLPVINNDDSLVGILTYDDALDIITQEHTEDMEKLMAISGGHEAGVYLKTSSFTHFKNRAVWVVGLALLGLVSGFIIRSFEDALKGLLLLTLYMPLMTDAGGNTGSQAATVVIRALALNEIGPSDIIKVVFKELKISFMTSALLGGMAFFQVLILSRNSLLPTGIQLTEVAGVIALALGLQVITATLVGALLPMSIAKIKLDPAVVASPALTTIVDISGLVIYFTTAKILLGL
ncbi:MAG: magnesium transporter [Deltaproteobacteria bacterium]|nr:MAG: magnesium transporter [Deltaproteobacteria bacterium]